MIILQYVLFFSIISVLILVILKLIGNRIPNKINYIILIFPLVLSIIILYLNFNIELPIDNRLIERPAKYIKHHFNFTETINGEKIEHNEKYSLVYEEDDKLKEKDIPKDTYYYFSKLWTKDSIQRGNIVNERFEKIYWNNDVNDALIYTKTESFTNYFKNIMHLYKFSDISDYTAVKNKLYNRGKNNYINRNGVLEPRQSLVYGINISDSISRSISYLGTLDNKFRPILLVWSGLGRSSLKIHGQRSYWYGGNDNEVVFCVGISDTITKKILWSGSFSWANNKDLEEYVLKTSLHPGQKLDLNNYRESLLSGYSSNLWQPRDFSSYSFIKIPLQNLLVILISIILIIIIFTIYIKLVKRRLKKNL